MLRPVLLNDGDATLGADPLARPHHTGDVWTPAVPRPEQRRKVIIILQRSAPTLVSTTARECRSPSSAGSVPQR